MAQSTILLDGLYSPAETIQVNCLLRIDVLVRTSESELATGLLRLLHGQLARERGDVTRSEDTAMDLRGGGRDIQASWHGHGHGSFKVVLFV